MIRNTFIHRTLLKGACAVLLPVCMLWSAVAALRAPATALEAAPQPEAPAQWEGRPLRPLALGEVERRFARQFPGSLARYAVEAPDGPVIVLRTAQRPTRLLHPASDCYRGLGFRIANEHLALDAHEQLWRCFEALRGGQQLQVCERIVDAQGRGFTDTSAWYWAAALGQSQGPWQAFTVARPL